MQRKLKAIPAIVLSCTLFFSQVTMAAEAAVMEATAVTQATAPTDPEETGVKISRDEAKKIATSLEFTKGYSVTGMNLENRGEGIAPIWRIDLSNPANNMNTTCSISISAENGGVVNYYTWYSGMYRKSIVTMTKKEAQVNAEKYLQQITKMSAENLEILSYPDYNYETAGGIYEEHSYNFYYAKKINGILSPDEGYSLSINASNGKLIRFDGQYPYLLPDYPSTNGVQDTAKLKEQFESQLHMQLQYQISYENNRQTAMLIYYPATPGQLDAKTMKPVKDELPMIYNLSEPKYVPMVSGAKVENKTISEDEGKKLIEKAKLTLEKELNVKFENSQGSFSIGGVQDQISGDYRVTINNKDYNFTIAINLQTGNICYCSFYSYIYNPESSNNTNSSSNPAKISYSVAKKKSDDLIKNLFPKQYGVFSDNNVEPAKDEATTSNSYSFQYLRVVNGIPVGNSILVSFDKQTGQLEQMNMNWNDIDFPSTDGIISAEQAQKAYLDGIKYQLRYYTPYVLDKQNIKKGEKAYIVFGPDTEYTNRIIDAKTGKLVNWQGQLQQANEVDENHWAANSIEILKAQGSLSGNVSGIDEEITRQDAVKMLSLTMGLQSVNTIDPGKNSFTDIDKDHPYYKYIENAVQLGIIQATDSYFNGTQRITKKEFITMLVNMLGYREIVEKLFPDQSGESNIALCKALDILPVKPGEIFNRYDTITLAEAAYSLQKALKYIR